MNERKSGTRFQRRAGIGTGTTSLLVIFTILCLATLAMLSLSTASSNRRIHQRSMTATANLATAEGKAAEQLAVLDDAFAQAQSASLVSTAAGQEVYYDAAKQAARRLGCAVDAKTGDITFAVDIDEENELVTVLHLLPPSSAQRYVIVSQVSVRTGAWVPGDDAEYWTGT